MNGQAFPLHQSLSLSPAQAATEMVGQQPTPPAVRNGEFPSRALAAHPLLANIEHYVVVLSTGGEDLGKRATLAFSTACTAQAMELDTQVFLVGDGSHWAYQKNTEGVHQMGFPALDDLIESFVEMEGKIYLCSACDAVCAVATEEDGGPLVRHPTIQPRGLASILEHMVGGSSVTF